MLTLKDVDPICEFKDFTIYYENSDDFLKIFRNLINNKKTINANFTNYSFRNNIERIVSDLNL